jgi:enhancing lycopene biosynthesis protein 2
MDGSEIHEAVCTLIALSEAGATYRCMAPDAPQMHVVNHLEGKPAEGESRNILVESARIARGEIDALGSVNVNDYDAFIFPGGFGAAKNLCSFAVDGPDCTVNPDVARLVREAHAAGKPLAFVCIAPVIAAKVLGETGTKLTIGTDEGTAQAINTMGGSHVECPVREVVIDAENRIISTPAYMTAQSVSDVFVGVSRTVSELLNMAG